MRARRRVLHLLVVVGLMASWVRQPCLPVDEATPSWRNGRHVPAVIDREARTDVPAERSESAGSRKAGGGAPPGPASPSHSWIAPLHGGSMGLVDAARSRHALLAQLHLRVNGTADAHGARA